MGSYYKSITIHIILTSHTVCQLHTIGQLLLVSIISTVAVMHVWYEEIEGMSEYIVHVQ